MRQSTILFCAIVVALHTAACYAADAAPPDFARDVAPIFAKYCAGCHNGTDREGELSLESFAELKKGGEKGAVIVPGRADASLMIRALKGEVEPAMPPEDNPHPSDKEVELLKLWIDGGAIGPEGSALPRPEIKTPTIAPATGVHPYLTSLAISPDGKRLAFGKYRRVELVDPASRKVMTTSGQLCGKVNGISFSRDGSLFVASSGVAGLYGVATICRTSDGATVSEITGHRDTIYDAELSPDGRLLATCSYDRAINLWDVASGKLVGSLTGHNGAVYDLAFSSDGSILASASADETVKIWKVKTGARLDTLGQPEGEQCAVGFTPDSKSIVAGGGDRQLRLWTLLSREKAKINPLKFSRTAHNSSIVKLAISPDGKQLVTASEGRELVLWNVATLMPILRYEEQPDVVTGLAFAPDGKRFYVARIDGSWHRYEMFKGKSESIAADDVPSPANSATFDATESAPQEFKEQEPNNVPTAANAITANSVVRGIIGAAANGAANVDVFRLHARKGQRLVLEINASRSKSPLDSKLEVLDADGNSIPRVVLQAVRSSYYTFRGHNSLDVDDFRMHGARHGA